ncbi:hypothetical protein [Haliangium sp. UPWRP_2]|uniref:hypothetical protein n=1 Tax=Haliangium sp. UPWRP_2 TaxID=1931276 RepID=UPI000B546D5A|nr:hypothetical protein [Haliangium sp. UPWRP_2]PSM31325.1 hypothetical protein BVG81_005985 [Haliangium sp. UPWRP_2]
MKKKSYFALALALPLSLGCNGGNIGGGVVDNDGGTGGGPPDFAGCVGLECNVDESKCTPNTPTSITGTVYIPSGTLPLYNAKVYIPTDPDPSHLPAVTTGIDLVNGSCDRCDSTQSDGIASAVTDLNGKFTLSPVPVGVAFPVVIRVGKWRRVVMVPPISTSCTSTPLTADQTRLPRTQAEGNIPKIALTTGNADALECLLRGPKLGLADSEFTPPSGNGRVNLYAGNGTSGYMTGVNGGAAFTAADPWWNQGANLAKYDIVLHSCQGGPGIYQAGSAANAHAALENYIAKGGRVFASHWHNIWIAGATPASLVPTVASFLDGTTGNTGFQDDSGNPILATINQSFDKGKSLAQWLVNANAPGAITLGQLPIKFSRVTLRSRNPALTTNWADFSDPNAVADKVASPASQYFSFNAPVGAAAGQQCGQMVFTDMHVSGDPKGDRSIANGQNGATPFPSGCKTPSLSPQEQALIFLLFDLTNCISVPIG